jgi:hypothetical protein
MESIYVQGIPNLVYKQDNYNKLYKIVVNKCDHNDMKLLEFV